MKNVALLSTVGVALASCITPEQAAAYTALTGEAAPDIAGEVGGTIVQVVGLLPAILAGDPTAIATVIGSGAALTAAVMKAMKVAKTKLVNPTAPQAPPPHPAG